MIAMVHRYHGALPGSRVELYSEICEVLLGRWRQAKGVKDLLTAAQKRVVLQPLAAHMMELKLRDIPQKLAVKVVEPFLKRVGVSDKRAADFLTELEASSGLFLERETGHWSFAHLTFQEYLTAAHWLGESSSSHHWTVLVSDSWWHETLRLYAAQGDATEVVEACLSADNLTSLALAADCLEEARELDPNMREEVVARVSAGLESSDDARRILAVKVQLARRLKSFQRIDDECEIDLEFISNAEYQYFANEMRALGEFYQPDHWTSFDYSPGEAQQPIRGMRLEDAEAFCRWLTEARPGNEHYRLPHQSEALAHPSKNLTIGALCNEDDRFSLVGLGQTTKDMIQTQITTLATSGFAGDQAVTTMFDKPLAAPGGWDLGQLLTVGLTFNLDLARSIIFNGSPASVRYDELEFAINLAVNRNLEHDDSIRMLLANARYNAFVLARKLARELMLARGRAIASEKPNNSARQQAFAKTLARQRDVDKDRDRDIDLRAVETLLNSTLRSGDPMPEGIIEIEKVVDTKMKTTDSPALKVRLAILKDLLTATGAKDILKARRIYRIFLAHTIESAYINLVRIQEEQSISAWRKEREALPLQKRRAVEIHCWLEVVMARESLEMLAWEGLRIARE
jgi:hypothetical protein